jgi:capsular polysaccharide biosynthesis protein
MPSSAERENAGEGAGAPKIAVETRVPTPRHAWPTIDDIVQATRRHWRVAAAVAVAITLFVWIIAAAQPKRYRAVATAAVAPYAQQMDKSEVLRGVDVLTEPVIIDTIAALAATPLTLRQTRVTPEDRVESDVVVTTNLFTVTVEARDPARAAAIANAVPAAVATQSRTLFPMYGVRIVSAATPPSRPALPRMPRALATGIILGIALGSLTAYAIERRRAGSLVSLLQSRVESRGEPQ